MAEHEKQKPRLYPLENLIDSATAEAEARFNARQAGTPLGPETCLKSITDALGGALAPGIHVLNGKAGAAKTAFALQTACTCRCHALYVTCEMRPTELLRRIAARVTGQYLGRFKSGEMPPDTVRAYFQQAAASAPLLTLLDATAAELTPAFLEQQATALRDKYRADGHEHFLIVIDSVHAWTQGIESAAGEYDKLNASVTATQQLAAKLNAPILCIAERNRVEKEGGLSSSAGTRKFEYGAESLIEIDKKDDQPDAKHDLKFEVTISKNRHGATTSKKLIFNGARQEFREA